MTRPSPALFADVPRKPNKPKAGKPVRMQIVFPAELVELVDAAAEKMTRETPFGRPATRTDALKALVVEGLLKAGLLPK